VQLCKQKKAKVIGSQRPGISQGLCFQHFFANESWDKIMGKNGVGWDKTKPTEWDI